MADLKPRLKRFCWENEAVLLGARFMPELSRPANGIRLIETRLSCFSLWRITS